MLCQGITKAVLIVMGVEIERRGLEATNGTTPETLRRNTEATTATIICISSDVGSTVVLASEASTSSADFAKRRGHT